MKDIADYRVHNIDWNVFFTDLNENSPEHGNGFFMFCEPIIFNIQFIYRLYEVLFLFENTDLFIKA